MNERLLIDQADQLINELGFFKLAIRTGDTSLAEKHVVKLVINIDELQRTLYWETHRSGEVS